jgi:hypothetical protein
MTIVTDQTAAVIDYLVSQCQASQSLGAATPPVQVFDGPIIDGGQLVSPQRIWIGADGMVQAGMPVSAATFMQSFAFLGTEADTRDDQIDIGCAAEVFDGDPTHQKQARDGAYALMAVVETMLRGNPNTGGPGDTTMGGLVYWSQVTGPGELIQTQYAAGVEALVKFRVTAFTRLTA